jgi:hypothetical protein
MMGTACKYRKKAWDNQHRMSGEILTSMFQRKLQPCGQSEDGMCGFASQGSVRPCRVDAHHIRCPVV